MLQAVSQAAYKNVVLVTVLVICCSLKSWLDQDFAIRIGNFVFKEMEPDGLLFVEVSPIWLSHLERKQIY